MVSIDLRTLVFSFVITNIIVTLIVVMLWYQNRKRFSGTFLWVINFLFQTTALILIDLRGAIPDLISMVVSNALAITGTILGLIALERFAGIKRNNYHNYILLLLFIFLSIWFSKVKPNLSVRNLNLASTMLIVTFQCSWLIFYKVKSELRKIAAGVGVVFLAYSLVNLLRIIDFFIDDHSVTEYFHSGKFEMFVIIAYQMLFILLTYNLALMFNKRLVSDVVSQEEKFSKAFHSSPYAIILTRFNDGKIFEVNKGFEDISGYHSSEVIGVTTNDLKIWYSEEERNALVEELARLGKVIEKELRFLKKSGEPLICLMSSEIISINNEKCVLSSIFDITKRKKTEESLKETEAILKAAMDCSPSGIAIADAPSGILRYVNKAGLMIPAKSEEEIVADIDINKYVSSWQIKHHNGTLYKPDEVPLARAVLYGETNSREFIISRDDNTDRIVLANAAPILGESGKVKAGIVVFHDITDYKQAEEKLRQQFFTLKVLNDSTPSPIFSVDTHYCYTSFNKTHAAVMKSIYNSEISIGLNILDCMKVENDRVQAKYNIDRALGGEQFVEDAFSGDEELSRVYFEVSHNPIMNDNSEVIGVAVLARDLTKRKRMEESLRETGEYLEKLINYANAPIIVWDTNLKITRFNSAFERLTGLSSDEVLNKKIDILFPPDSREESMVSIRNTTMGTRWEVVEIPIATIDGTIRTVIWNSATIYDKDGITPVSAIAQGQDITERKQAEEEIKTKVAELEQFNRLSVGREMRLIELKQKINGLSAQLNLPHPYALDYLKSTDNIPDIGKNET